MDKRWIGIFLIIIIGAGCLYLIISSSDTVGKAVTVCDEMTITLPTGFNLLHSNPKDVTLLNHQNETIFIKIIGLNKDTLKLFNDKVSSLKSNDSIEVEKTSNENNTHIVYYKNLNTGNESIIAYFVKDNRTISMEMNQYPNYREDFDFVFDSIVHNFKQNTDME
ncbi:MAG: hypothetical protein E7Z80_05545 [Methanobrevibacter thaueri]|nr:hypothetical protein [Methanobrevibacter thaueri]